MGLITGVMSALFGGGSSVREVVEVFRENAEGAAVREAAGKAAALNQLAAEFQHERKGWFDRLIDGLNRLPRPMLAMGTIALFVAAMWTPDWFGQRMAGVALIPEPLWWLMGAIVSFYFGARHQVKGQEFQRSVVQTLALQRAVTSDSVAEQAPLSIMSAHEAPDTDDNAALADWWASRGQ